MLEFQFVEKGTFAGLTPQNRIMRFLMGTSLIAYFVWQLTVYEALLTTDILLIPWHGWIGVAIGVESGGGETDQGVAGVGKECRCAIVGKPHLVGEEPDIQQFPDLIEVGILLQHLQGEGVNVKVSPRLAEKSLVAMSETRPVVIIREPRQGIIDVVVVEADPVVIDDLAIMEDIAGCFFVVGGGCVCKVPGAGYPGGEDPIVERSW